MKLLNNQKGFTLVEMLASLAISGILLTGMVTSILQTIRITDSSNTQVVALDDIRSVGHEIVDDIRKAESTDLVDQADPVSSVYLTWTDWTETQPYRHESTLALLGTTITRTRNAWVDVDLDRIEDVGETAIVIDESLFFGRFISDIEFSLDGDIVIVTITSTPDNNATSVYQKTYRIALSGLEDPVR